MHLRLHEPVFGCISRWLMYGYSPGGGALTLLTTRNEDRIARMVSVLYMDRNGKQVMDPENAKALDNTLAILDRNDLLGSFSSEQVVNWQGFDNLKDNDPERLKMLSMVIDYDLFRSFAPE
jgi:hypothetical protein